MSGSQTHDFKAWESGAPMLYLQGESALHGPTIDGHLRLSLGLKINKCGYEKSKIDLIKNTYLNLISII